MTLQGVPRVVLIKYVIYFVFNTVCIIFVGEIITKYMDLKARLALMGFLGFDVWSACLTCMSGNPVSVGLGDMIPWLCTAQGIVSIFMSHADRKCLQCTSKAMLKGHDGSQKHL